MERVAVQKVVESVRHPPALYWGVVSAAALCWGTSAALAKRNKNQRHHPARRNRSRATPGVAFKRLRRKYAEKLRPLLEDLVYLTMAVLNNLVGILYWLLDCCYEGWPKPHRNYFTVADVALSTQNATQEINSSPTNSAPADDEKELTGSLLYKPRRGAIMRLRTRLVRINSLRGRRQTCGCWGWVVHDLVVPCSKLPPAGSQPADDESEEELPLRESVDTTSSSSFSATEIALADVATAGSASASECASASDDSPQQEGGGERPRWSECHCPQCAVLLIPMSMAAGKLYVRRGDNGGDGNGDKPQEQCITADLKGSIADLRSAAAAAVAASAPDCTESSAASEDNNVAADSDIAAPPTKDCRTTAVIFIHGLFSSSTFWFDTDVVPSLSAALTRRHRVLAPDLLGCGRSPRPVDSLYTLADQVDAVERSVVQRHALQSFHLVGHSMGSIVALALAARCPARVRSVTLIAPVYPPGCLREDGQLAQLPCDAFFSYLNPFTLKGIRALTVCKYYNISRLLGHMFYSKHVFWVSLIHRLLQRYPKSFINDYLSNYHDAAWHITHNTLLAGTHAVIPALQRLQASGLAVLVIHGENDSSIQFRLAEEMSRTFANVELVAVPGKGHVDVVWGRAAENILLIEKAILEGDARWSASRGLTR